MTDMTSFSAWLATRLEVSLVSLQSSSYLELTRYTLPDRAGCRVRWFAQQPFTEYVVLERTSWGLARRPAERK
eukprot:6202603-Pleurochrysis_carterae.AAC.1